jgi:hypothetical protein
MPAVIAHAKQWPERLAFDDMLDSCLADGRRRNAGFVDELVQTDTRQMADFGPCVKYIL